MYYAAATMNFRINVKDNIFKDLCPGPVSWKMVLLTFSDRAHLQDRSPPAQSKCDFQTA